MTDRSRRTVLWIALVLAMTWTAAPAAAQDPPADTAPAPSTETVPAPEAAPAVEATAARLFVAENLNDHFNAVLNTINGFVGTALFFDVSFGAFDRPAVDDNGQPVYSQNPVPIVAANDMDGYQLDSDGNIKRDPKTRLPVVVAIKAGDDVLQVGPDGELVLTQGAQETERRSVPFLVLFLIFGAVFYTFWHGWINIRGFKHAIDVVRGKFTNPDDPGDVTPFRALTAALSATVGLGNIAGVAIAVKLGGPGAIFWMMFLGLFGMTAKFHESTLAQLFRTKNADGTISGGPMFYLDKGLKDMGAGLGVIGKVLAIIFAIFCMGGALGGGNMFQANQSFEGFFSTFVETESLAEKSRATVPIDKLRPLLTDKQLAALRKSEKIAKQTPLEQVRTDIPENRVRAVLLPSQIEETLPAGDVYEDHEERGAMKKTVSYGFGVLMAVMVGVVVIGGITRIGAATSKIVPTMCLLYVGGCLFVIIFNIGQVPGHVAMIFSEAFNWNSTFGGLVGVIIVGFQRAAFSSEAGLGSSAIAHSAAQTSEPVREGFVASLEPFVDTIIICFMTAMVVLITDAYVAPELIEEANGSKVTLYAFQQTALSTFFPYILAISIVLFAFSTMISWCYYGERAYGYLFGMKTVVIFRLVFVAAVFVGAVADLGPVLDFSDLMILSMAFPNILGGLILGLLVKRKLQDYWRRYRAGEFPTVD